MKEVRRKKKQQFTLHYLSATTEEINLLLDGYEDTLNVITKNPKLVNERYRVRLKMLGKRIEEVLKE